ncbi:cytochrome P450 [Virgisporangium ochraceum]|uniref:Cytochrome P450 n=1 Tax=Virgisporangium ochraceum TaxID=65505 RepID=A0A8J4EJ15_9ACTN|nr:cytochrome P450 [Virgisporangium ochraceum]GIJ73827.1 cytochrome P450 [Virgisporangium ochraceum]
MSIATKLAADPTSVEAQNAFFPWLRERRENAPVSLDPETGHWSVFRYDDCVRVMNDPHTFSNDLTDLTPPQEDYDLFLKGNLATMDEPRHRRMRLLVSRAFTPRFIASLKPRMIQIAAGILDGLDGTDEFDVVPTLASSLPLTVICELLGVPMEDRETFREWAHVIHDNGGESVEQMLVVAPAVRAMNGYLRSLIRQRRAHPREDLVTKMVSAEHEGRRLEEDEIIGFIGLLLIAGHLTTTAMITNIPSLFDSRPDLWTQLRADRDLVKGTIEEIVRYRPSFTRFVRRTLAESEIGGQRIPAGDLLNVWIASANRDEAHFQRPDEFDIRRDPNRHLGFGQGIHYCIGAWLARIEGDVALNALLDRFTRVSVQHERGVTYLDPDIMLGATVLPVRVTRP